MRRVMICVVFIAIGIMDCPYALSVESTETNPSISNGMPAEIQSYFKPPIEYSTDLGSYPSPLQFKDGTWVKNTDDWLKRRREILKTWQDILGSWPPLITNPKIEYQTKTHRDNFIQHQVLVEIAPGQQNVRGYLLIPDGNGPFPAVLVVYYDADTGVGLGKENRDFGYQLAKRGFVVLSIGTPDFCNLKPPYSPQYNSGNSPPLQPLSALAYVAANSHSALAQLREVAKDRIGIVGHSYGGKWALFASCLYEKFACGVWSDPGIVFDESRPSVNYWEPWYLGYAPGKWRTRGVITPRNPCVGLYPRLVAEGYDLHELHALMAPRPFLVSGGSEDPPARWQALNHTIRVNSLLGYERRVGMTNRPKHDPTPESNEAICLFFEYFLKHGRAAP